MKALWKIFLVFLKIGAFTFGGGYAMIPLIQREVVENKKWVTEEDLLDIVAIAESTPGPIAINAATFVGQQTAGFAGAVVATLGVVLPSFLCIFTVFHVLQAFQEAKAVQYAFTGIRVGVLVLIIKALVKMFRTGSKNLVAYSLMVLSFVLTAVVGMNTFLVIGLCAVVGLASSLAGERRQGK